MESDLQLSRIEKERAFHNKEFADRGREKVDSVYVVSRQSKKRFEEIITDGAENSKVLEYGCGPHSYAFFLANLGATVSGIDISDEAIEQMRERSKHRPFPERVSFQTMNAEELEFPDDEFDLVTGRAILHHLDLRKSFEEIARTMKPTGKAVFVEPLGHNPVINFFRNRTPELRTEDEHPLLEADLEMAKEYFGKVEVHYYHLAGLAATPFVGTKLFEATLKTLDAIDQVLFKTFPFTRKHAWAVVLVFSEPKL